MPIVLNDTAIEEIARLKTSKTPPCPKCDAGMELICRDSVLVKNGPQMFIRETFLCPCGEAYYNNGAARIYKRLDSPEGEI